MKRPRLQESQRKYLPVRPTGVPARTGTFCLSFVSLLFLLSHSSTARSPIGKIWIVDTVLFSAMECFPVIAFRTSRPFCLVYWEWNILIQQRTLLKRHMAVSCSYMEATGNMIVRKAGLRSALPLSTEPTIVKSCLALILCTLAMPWNPLPSLGWRAGFLAAPRRWRNSGI